MSSPQPTASVPSTGAVRITFQSFAANARFEIHTDDWSALTDRIGKLPEDKLVPIKSLLERLRGGAAEASEGRLTATGTWGSRGEEALRLVEARLAVLAEAKALAAVQAPARQEAEARASALRAAQLAVGKLLDELRSTDPGQRTTGSRTVPSTRPYAGAGVVVGQAAVVPKDLSARPRTMHMGFQVKTTSEMDPPAKAFTLVDEMVSIGRLEGFTVVLGHPALQLAEVKKGVATSAFPGLHRVSVDAVGPWREDAGELQRDGKVGVPAEVSGTDARAWIEADRRVRGYVVPEALAGTEIGKEVERVGNSVAQDRKWREMEALATVTKRQVVHYRSHFEGGNVLTGAAGGHSFALVGRDAVAVTRGLLARAGQDSSDGGVRRAFAADLGIDADRVFFVEHPGQFHLDMGMLVLADGTVLLNSSTLVLETLLHWAEQDRRTVLDRIATKPEPGLAAPAVEAVFTELRSELTAQLAALARLEDKAEDDLRAAQLTVVRVPGVFPQTLVCPRMNFLNGEIGTGARGGFFVTNGGDARAEDLVAQRYFAATDALRAIHFLDPAVSAESLVKGGGIGCRVKSSEWPADS